MASSKETLSSLKSLNISSTHSQLIEKTPFNITAPPDTDLWRKPSPPHPHLASNQPSYVHTLALSSFTNFRASFAFTADRLYDQGGLLILFPNDAWVKAGIEHTGEDGTMISIVARPPGETGWADWSVHGAADPAAGLTMIMERKAKSSELVLKVVRDKAGEDEGTKEVVREVTWAFGDVYGEKQEEQEVKVGVYAARPDPDKQGGEGLEVTFHEFLLDIPK